MRFALFIFLFALASQAQGKVKYVPPNDSQPLIRRDLIPLDVDAIRDLAENLALLADGPAPKSASQLRNRVQALTLSQRLSPAQARARAIMEALATRQNRAAPEKEDLKSARRTVLSATDWLVKLPADSEGHRLGQLLLDIIQPIAQNEPVLEHHDRQNAPQRWKGVIAKVTAFEKRDRPAPSNKNTPPMPVQPAQPSEDESSYAVSALLTEIPMITGGLNKEAKIAPGLIKTSLVITKNRNENDNLGRLRFKPDSEYSTKALELALENFFRSIDQALPKGHNLNVNTDKRRYLTLNRQNIVAPLAMMLDAAISGRPLRRNTILFADLHIDGSLIKPAKAWDILLDLESLRVPDGTRLIVGSGMLEEMTALLVLQKATFFTKFEVIEAPSFEIARELFYEDGKPSDAARAAISGYQEVREKALVATNFNTFLSLTTVEQRLIKARDHSPQHLSARMLATQAIRRPAYFSRFMFAQELDRRLEGISQLKATDRNLSDRAIKTAYKAAREEVDPLGRLVERQERLVLDEAVDTLKKLNSVGRVTASAYDSQKGIQRIKDLGAFQLELTNFRQKLRQIYQPAKE